MSSQEYRSKDQVKAVYKLLNECVVDKINSVSVDDNPFPHFVIDDFLPPEFYQYLKEITPTEDQCIDLKSTRLVTPNYPPNRYLACIKDYIKGHTRIQSHVDDKAKLKHLYVLYRWFAGVMQPKLAAKFGIEIPESSYDELLYIIDKQGYQLTPHTDYRMKLFSAILYVPDEGTPSTHGTSIYTPKEKGFSCWANKMYSFNKFDLVKTVEYKPNTLFAFVRSDTSFHGVSPVPPGVMRKSYIYDVKKML